MSKTDLSKTIFQLTNNEERNIINQLVLQLPESMDYLQHRFKISKIDAYDICMDTFLDFRLKMLENKISKGNLRYLYTRMCINHFVDSEKKNKKIEKAIRLFHHKQENGTLSKEVLFSQLDKALKQLTVKEQNLLLELYCSGNAQKSIALEQKVSYSNLRKKKERILTKLRIIYFDEEDKE